MSGVSVLSLVETVKLIIYKSDIAQFSYTLEPHYVQVYVHYMFAAVHLVELPCLLE